MVRQFTVERLERHVILLIAEVIGDTLKIPTVVMGLTVLAAGTSVPDLLISYCGATGKPVYYYTDNSARSESMEQTFSVGLATIRTPRREMGFLK